MLPVEGTETSVRRRFMSSYQASKCAIVTTRSGTLRSLGDHVNSDLRVLCDFLET
jgi:hypothetical protein